MTKYEQVDDRVVVSVDLSRYSDIALDMAGHGGAGGVLKLDTTIARHIEISISQAGIPPSAVITRSAGDGALLVIDVEEAPKAVAFCEAVHRIANAANEKEREKDNPKDLYERHYRTGCYLDSTIVVQEEEDKPVTFAGPGVFGAVRLEAACSTGEVLISKRTWQLLDEVTRRQYAGPRKIQGKRDENFEVYARRVCGPAPWETPSGKRPAVQSGREQPSRRRNWGVATLVLTGFLAWTAWGLNKNSAIKESVYVRVAESKIPATASGNTASGNDEVRAANVLMVRSQSLPWTPWVRSVPFKLPLTVDERKDSNATLSMLNFPNEGEILISSDRGGKVAMHAINIEAGRAVQTLAEFTFAPFGEYDSITLRPFAHRQVNAIVDFRGTVGDGAAYPRMACPIRFRAGGEPRYAVTEKKLHRDDGAVSASEVDAVKGWRSLVPREKQSCVWYMPESTIGKSEHLHIIWQVNL